MSICAEMVFAPAALSHCRWENERRLSIVLFVFAGALFVAPSVVALEPVSSRFRLAESTNRWDNERSSQRTRRALQDSVPKVLRRSSDTEVQRDEPVDRTQTSDVATSDTSLIASITSNPVLSRQHPTTPSQLQDGISTSFGPATTQHNPPPELGVSTGVPSVSTSPSVTTSGTPTATTPPDSSTPTHQHYSGEYETPATTATPTVTTPTSQPEHHPTPHTQSSRGAATPQPRSPSADDTPLTSAAVTDDVQRTGVASYQRSSGAAATGWGTQRNSADVALSGAVAGSGSTVTATDQTALGTTATATEPPPAGTADELQKTVPTMVPMQPAVPATGANDGPLPKSSLPPPVGSAVTQSVGQRPPYEPVELQTTTSTPTAGDPPVQRDSRPEGTQPAPPAQTVSTPTTPDSTGSYPAPPLSTTTVERPTPTSTPAVGGVPGEPGQRPPFSRLAPEDPLYDIPEEPAKYEPDAEEVDVGADEANPQLLTGGTTRADTVRHSELDKGREDSDAGDDSSGGQDTVPAVDANGDLTSNDRDGGWGSVVAVGGAGLDPDTDDSTGEELSLIHI